MTLIDSLISWYLSNKRDLPWRNTKDPYLIWLSEIILQQTRVEQGYPYYIKFAETFPSVSDFAEAPEDQVLRLWQGLGYYSRARNMHKTAQMVMEDFNGSFPNKYNDLIKLKGIGDYTAAAISSFSSNETQAVVDGNVFRVLARYFGIEDPIDSTAGKKVFRKLADNVINPTQADTSNQAIMEFGAMLCKPKPLCEKCPVGHNCFALKNNRIASLPIKRKKTASKDRFFHYLVIEQGGNIFIRKRKQKDIWINLYEFPLLESDKVLSTEEILNESLFLTYFDTHAIVTQEHGPLKHLLSHQNLYIKFFKISLSHLFKLKQDDWLWVPIEDFADYAKPIVIANYYQSLRDSL